MYAIEIFNLTKEYGKIKALDNLSLNIEENTVVGLLGPNGAGKTTLLRILATLIKPNSGYAKIIGYDGRYHAEEIRRRIGFMPDSFGLYKNLKVIEYMYFFAYAYKINVSDYKSHISSLLELVDLKGLENHLIEGLSRGMQQRLGLARTLIHNPEVLLLDEPASGLDPAARYEICEVLKELKNMGKTIFISSHILPEIEDICDKVVIIDNGKILFHGEIEESKKNINTDIILLEIEGEYQGLINSIKQTEDFSIISTSNGHIKVRINSPDADINYLLLLIIQHKCRLKRFIKEEGTLQDVFLKITGYER